jgi:hypothetical protein
MRTDTRAERCCRAVQSRIPLHIGGLLRYFLPWSAEKLRLTDRGIFLLQCLLSDRQSFEVSILQEFVLGDEVADSPSPLPTGGRRFMLQQLTAKQRERLEHAALCRARTEAVSNPIDKNAFLQMADGWELFTRSYSYCERLSDFTARQKTVSRNCDSH